MNVGDIIQRIEHLPATTEVYVDLEDEHGDYSVTDVRSYLIGPHEHMVVFHVDA